MLYETSSRRAQAWITQSYTCHSHVYTRKGRATPGIYIRNHQQQSPTLYSLLHISPTHERMIDCVKLESATGSWRQMRVCYHTATCSLNILYIYYILNILLSYSITACVALHAFRVLYFVYIAFCLFINIYMPLIWCGPWSILFSK